MLGFDSVKFDAQHVTFKVNKSDSLFEEILDGARTDGAFHGVGSICQQFSVITKGFITHSNVFDRDVIVVDDSNPADRGVEYPETGHMPIDQLDVYVARQFGIAYGVRRAARHECHAGKKSRTN